MKRICFNDSWTVKREQDHHSAQAPAIEVKLPHDAMFASGRDENAWNGTKKAFFVNGVWEYVKTFEVPQKWADKHAVLVFEGVYSQAMVYVNNSFAGQRPYGYSEFTIALDTFLQYGQVNTVKVIARTADDSRWYSGAGIYRNVFLLVSALTHIPDSGVRVQTPQVSTKKAMIAVETTVSNLSTKSVTANVQTELISPDGTIAGKDTAPITLTRNQESIVRQRLCVESPALWDIDSPALYVCKTTLIISGEAVDTEENLFGIRIFILDTLDGLQINGKTVKLRGCCIHHDNGVIGARTFVAAEYRKIKKLKEAGFNAIRSAHHPASRPLLSACDELGMLVMDEAFDMWTICKSSKDYALHFPLWWERDIEAMVAKDFNHPSVLMYSIGNEIFDVQTSHGTSWGRKIAEKLHQLDKTRFTTSAVNGMLCVMDKLQAYIAKKQESMQDAGRDINETMADIGQKMGDIALIPEVGVVTEETFSTVDIAGYNYMVTRYETDHTLYPNRLIVGSETFSRDIAAIWRLVKNNTYMLGDFCWTGMDYLGETGIGMTSYGEKQRTIFSFYSDYPWVTAHCGDIDITGHRLPVSYYREIVFGLRTEPYIAVQDPMYYGKTASPSPWGWSDSLSSWSFDGFEGSPVCVEVYADADEAALLLNGSVVGRKAIGDDCKAIFETFFQPGTLEAVAYRAGTPIGRYALMSASTKVVLQATAERDVVKADGQDLVYIGLALTDENGSVHIGRDRTVTLCVEGGELIGFGSGAPETRESYLDSDCTTYRGRALAVVLPVGAGSIKVTAVAKDCAPVAVTVTAE
jgi:beta-galactosidase